MNSDTPVREDFDHYLVPTYAPAAFIPVRGEGSTVFDQSGKSYIDFAGGIAVNALGHANPELQEALMQQAGKLWHMGNGYTNEPVLALAKQLVEATFAEKVFFCNSGAEANEAALKLARKYALEQSGAEKNEIIAFTSAFHGRTLFTVSAGGQPKYSQDFAPLPGGIHHVAYNDLDAVRAVISERTCAVIVEPIQGEGGVIPATTEFLQGLRALCDEYNALLIFDEVQTGVGRTGSLYAYMNYGVEPDVLSTAKALGGGFPIGAILTKDRYATALSVGSHGTTYGGNPLATAVAGKAFSIIRQPAFLSGVVSRHQFLVDTLQQLNRELAVFRDIRGAGLLIGCELNETYAGQAKQISQMAVEEGVLTLIAGPDVVRFAPALNISADELENGCQRFRAALTRYVQK
ncbi:bifunctional succinylornithine transaminase/acetylornithine transaminase [Vibrio mangrovi]|uniref:Acetylornithine aminotransferase n=1 Tax=Vibrio mangrovi TaxID=474394 RepID=A0A1Y6J2N5_9VIBR|nr:bifunctional succinylornithine transaminase/acetylornithine transaminase [Vibrio mangrovi]MDW6005217.1 bifunctional succinylornithine transaminase/acetylornithine transaminase [Vibrio mangrovi]SMS02573.1 Succinylornithine transaminase [Vibrio mangrovi]